MSFGPQVQFAPSVAFGPKKPFGATDAPAQIDIPEPGRDDVHRRLYVLEVQVKEIAAKLREVAANQEEIIGAIKRLMG